MMGAKTNSASMKALPADFVPGPGDVICARGKEAKNHEGNKKYRALIESALERYAKATTKYEKSIVVSGIIDVVRKASPDGGFIKKENGQWWDVGEHLAREKVGQNLRDSLSDQYKSSTKAKRIRRKQVQKGIAGNVEGLIQTNQQVADRLGQLSQDMKERGKEAPEVFMAHMFTQANREILEAMKKDEDLVNEFKKVEKQQGDGDP